eukprot:symbB.v1.2.005434.t1/scaffold312.1/size231221/10
MTNINPLYRVSSVLAAEAQQIDECCGRLDLKGWIAEFLASFGGGEFFYNVDWKKFPDSDILRPHCTLPLAAADVLIQTPPGEEPPSLMAPMEHIPSAVKKARCFNSGDTYTIAWWSKYLDLFRWRSINFPLGLNGALESYTGREVHVSIFRLPLEEELKAMEADGLPPPNDWLCESQKLTFLRMKVTHSAISAEEEFEECVDWDELEEDLDLDALAMEKGSPLAAP